MELDRIEFLLDDGWNLIGRLHQWLSKWPNESHEQSSATELIHGLQRIWSAANDLNAMQLARTSLALELMLERFCAGTLELSTQRMEDFTTGVGCLQELLLGLEATREEPEFPDRDALLRIERHVLAAAADPEVEVEEKLASETEHSLEASVELEHNVVLNNSTVAVPIDAFQEEEVAFQEEESTSVECTLLRMLEQFVMKLDSICQQLHTKIVADQTPYASTTSRLEHLAQVTRELVGQILQHRGLTEINDSLDVIDSVELTPVEEASSVAFAPEIMANPAELNPPEVSTFAAELKQIAKDLDAMMPGESVVVEESIEAPTFMEFTRRPPRVLIIEESLFYRHMLSTAVQAAGFEPMTCDSLDQGFTTLEESIDFAAVLVDAATQSSLIQAFKRITVTKGARLIGMTSTASSTTANQADFDGCAAKAHPQKLANILNRVLQDSAVHVQISA